MAKTMAFGKRKREAHVDGLSCVCVCRETRDGHEISRIGRRREEVGGCGSFRRVNVIISGLM
jgi:hypothetical protein